MVRYRIEIDRDLCVGDKACWTEARCTFDRDDEPKAIVTDPQGNPPEDILAAARNCRFQAITLFDADTDEQVWPAGS